MLPDAFTHHVPWPLTPTVSSITIVDASATTLSATTALDYIHGALLLLTLVCTLSTLYSWARTRGNGAIRLDEEADAVADTGAVVADGPGQEEADDALHPCIAHHRDTERLKGRPVDQAGYAAKVKKLRTTVAVSALFVLAIDVIDARVRLLGSLESICRPPFSLLIDGVQWAAIIVLVALPWTTDWSLFQVISIFSVITLSLLIRVARVSLYLQFIQNSNGQSTTPTPLYLQIPSLIIVVIAWTASGFIPLGPKRQYQGSKESVTREVYPADEGGEASLLSRLCYLYAFPLAKAALHKGSLHTEDLYGPSYSWRGEKVAADLGDAYEKESKHLRHLQAEAIATGIDPPRTSMPLVLAITKANLSTIAWGAVLTTCVGLASVVPVLCINGFLKALESADGSGYERCKTVAPWAVALLIVTTLLATLKSYTWYWFNICIYFPLQGQLSTLLVAKALRVKVTTVLPSKRYEGGDDDATRTQDEHNATSNSGQLLTLLSTDVSRVSFVGWSTSQLIATPLEVATGLWFLYSILGSSALWGLTVSIFAAPLTYYLGTLSAKIEDRMQCARDKRTSLIVEMLKSLKMIKLHAWEQMMKERVDLAREEELRSISAEFNLGILMYAVSIVSPILAGLLTLGHYTLVRGETLTPSIAFPALSALQSLQGVLARIPDEIISILQASVSLRRIAGYLQKEEIASVGYPRLANPKDQLPQPAFHNATISWPIDRICTSLPRSGQDQEPFQLSQITIGFVTGGVNLVTGGIGEGKTLLLHALLGEAEIVSGSVSSPRSAPTAIASDRKNLKGPYRVSDWLDPFRIAYVPQTAYLQGGTIKDNVLFGLPMWTHRYQSTLEACGLKPDILGFPDGDSTIVGENGMTLSGGQKARLSLARAIYSRATLLLLDDCLSAVDAELAAHIHSVLLRGALCKGRTIILVSQQTDLLSDLASLTVVLQDGRVQAHHRGHSGQPQMPIADFVKGDTSSVDISPQGKADIESPRRTDTVAEETTQLDQERKASQQEPRALGSISLKMYLDWLLAGKGASFWLFVASLFLTSSTSAVLSGVWLKWWMQQSSSEPRKSVHSTLWWFTWYSAISLGALVIRLVRSYWMYRGTLASSRSLFRRMIQSILRAPMSFHDSCPHGRLLSRFGSDFQTVDQSVPNNLMWFIPSVLAVLTNIGAAIFGGGLIAILPVIVVLPIYVWYGRLYCTVVRDARRLSRLAYSKVTSAAAEIASATSVIRAFGASEHLRLNFLDLYDEWMMALLATPIMSFFVRLRIEFAGALVTFLTAVLIILDPGSGWGLPFTAATAGFLLTTVKAIQEAMEGVLYVFAGLEQSLVSVERVMEHCELPSEAAGIVEPRPPAAWPSQGSIEFKDVSARYATDLPLVLSDICFSILPASKIAIVGPSGSGKSTLVSSLFRVVEADSGQILIDGLDIAKMGLLDLRSKLQIVPQDPSMPAGSFRSVIDVRGTYSDAEILGAMNAVGLADEGRCTTLDAPIAEGGGNLSGGQKQLFCLARCILSKSKIVVLDEATSSTDDSTDAIISKSVLGLLADSTVIAIAHRLRSIIDFDKVLVIEEGKVVEFDTPRTLLQRGEASKFYRLCKASGPTEFAHLCRRALCNDSIKSTPTAD